METNSVEDTLKERGEVYGDYKGGNEFRTALMKLIQKRYRDVQSCKKSFSRKSFKRDGRTSW